MLVSTKKKIEYDVQLYSYEIMPNRGNKIKPMTAAIPFNQQKSGSSLYHYPHVGTHHSMHIIYQWWGKLNEGYSMIF